VKNSESALVPRCIAAVLAAVFTFGIALSPASAQSARGPLWPEGCLARGVSFPVDYYLPHLWGGWLVVSDERRDAQQLAAAFADPADALARLDAWCWIGQAERVWEHDDMTIDVSIHDFLGTDGVPLAQAWFSEQRASDLDLTRETQTRAELAQELGVGSQGPIGIAALDDLVIDAYVGDDEYTLYARRAETSYQTGGSFPVVPPDKLVRVTASSDPSHSSSERKVEAYRVLADIFGVSLFPGWA
jgi:hypothetical protein